MKDKLILFLKGLLTGVADLVPGISGGTIALILGIYKKLVDNIKLASTFFKNPKVIFHLDYKFLIPLALGIVTSIIFVSKLIDFLLTYDPGIIYGLFLGLIVYSIYFLGKNFEAKKNYKQFFLGALIGIIITFLNIQIQQPTNFLLPLIGFMIGFIMLLPGISASYLLLILGVYGVLINYISNFQNFLLEIFLIVIGLITGFLVLANIASFLLKKYKNKFISLLTGIILGTLPILVFIFLENISILAIILLLKSFLLSFFFLKKS